MMFVIFTHLSVYFHFKWLTPLLLNYPSARFLNLTEDNKKKSIWLAACVNFPPSRTPNNVCIAAVISQIIGKIEKAAKDEGADREERKNVNLAGKDK